MIFTSKILINDNEFVEGSFSFDVAIDDKTSPPVYSISGVLTTSEKYIDELQTIQNDRYRLERVKVYQESFGSEEDSVVYFFTAGLFGRSKGR